MKTQTSSQQLPSTPSFDLDLHLKKRAQGLTKKQVGQIRKHPCAGNQEFIETLIENANVFGARVFGQSDEFVANFNACIACTTIVELESLALENEIVQMEEWKHLDSVVPVFDILWAAYPNISRAELMGVLDWKRSDWKEADYIVSKKVSDHEYTLKTEAIRAAIKLRFVATPELEAAAHAKIAAYFLKALKSADAPLSDYGRKNLVKHLVLSGDRDGVTDVLSDLRYLESRVCAKEIDGTLEDFAKAAAFLAESPAHLQKLEAFRRLFALNRIALTIEGSAEGRLVQIAYNASASGHLREAAEKALAGKSAGSLQRIHGPTATRTLSPCRAILEPTAEEKNGCMSAYIAVPSPDGRMLATAGEDNGMIRIWNLETGVCLKAWKAHGSFVSGLHFISGGARLISFGDDQAIRIWDVVSAECLKDLGEQINTPHHFAIATNASKIVSTSRSESFVWDFEQEIVRIPFHAGGDISPDGKWIIGSSGVGLRVWDSTTGDVVSKIKGTSCAIDGKWENAVVLNAKGEIRIVDLLSGKTRRALEGTLSGVFMLAISSNGSKATALCEKGRLIVWDVASGRRLHEWKADEDYNQIQINNDGSLVAGAYLDIHLGTDIPVCVWSVETGAMLLVASHKKLSDFKFTPDTRELITAGHDISCRLWELPSEASIPSTGATTRVSSMVFSSQSDLCFVGKVNGALEVWDSKRAECVKVLDGHKNKIGHLLISPCGKRLVSCAENELRIWDLESDTCIVSLEDECFSNNHFVQITSDSKRLVTAGWSSWRLWDLESGELLRKIKGHTGAFSSLKISDDDKLLLTSSSCMDEKGPKIWDLATGECLHDLDGEEYGVQGADATGDFLYILSSGTDNMNLWNGLTGERIRTCDLFTGEKVVHSSRGGGQILHLASDGRTLLVNHMRKARFWDLETMEPIQEFSGNHTYLKSVTMSPDGEFVVYLDGNGFLQMKRSDGTLVFEVFCRHSAKLAIDWGKDRLAVGYADGRVEFHQIKKA